MTVRSLTVRVGLLSLSMIVPVAVADAIELLIGLLSVRVNVSFVSGSVSPITGTEIVCDVVPGGNVTVPVVVV